MIVDTSLLDHFTIITTIIIMMHVMEHVMINTVIIVNIITMSLQYHYNIIIL